MKKLLFLSFLIASPLFASQDRFGSMRSEVPRSSFTNSQDIGVVIASNPANAGGGFILRYVYCSGVVPSTITFFNAVTFSVDSSTRDVFTYQPVTPAALLVPGTAGASFDAYYSSGIAYIKYGAAPCGIRWDYLTVPASGIPYRP